MTAKALCCALTFLTLVAVYRAAIIDVTCPTSTVPPDLLDTILVNWTAETDLEKNASGVFFFDENDSLCHRIFQIGPDVGGGNDLLYAGSHQIQCTERFNNKYVFYIMEIYGAQSIITEEDVLYKLTCDYSFIQNISATVTILTDRNNWGAPGSPGVSGAPVNEVTAAISDTPAVLRIIQVEEGDEQDVTEQTTAVGSTLYLRANVSFETNFQAFKIVDVWAFRANCTDPAVCPGYEVFQLYEAECPTDAAMNQLDLDGPAITETADDFWMVSHTDNFTSFRFQEPTTSQGGTEMLFVMEIYLCNNETDPECVQDSCVAPGRRRRSADPEDPAYSRLEARVAVFDKYRPRPIDIGEYPGNDDFPENEQDCNFDLTAFYTAIGLLLFALLICFLIIGYMAHRLRRKNKFEETRTVYAYPSTA